MGSLFGSKPKTPEIKPPTPLPDEDAIRKARMKDVAAQKKRTGRQSTILSDETLG